MANHTKSKQGGGSKLGEMFPSKSSAVIFVVYMLLFVNQGILVRSSQTVDNRYSYNVSSVVLASELLKLLICSVWYVKKSGSFGALITDSVSHVNVGIRYLIPALLYCLYNNLSFVNLANYDPTTYFILLQLRNVITGVIYQILFHKKLSRRQWVSLFILTFGCVVKQLGGGHQSADGLSLAGILNFQLVLILIQLFCSCFAGVYNEYLLKDKQGAQVDILIQNIYMYLNSIVCNVLFLLCSPLQRTTAATSNESLFDLSFLSYPIVWAILLNGAIAGITTSFFLKSLNSIMKTFAATIEIAITAVVCLFLFSTPIDVFTLLSIMLIFIALYIYSQNPLATESPKQSPTVPVVASSKYTKEDCDVESAQALLSDCSDDDDSKQ